MPKAYHFQRRVAAQSRNLGERTSQFAKPWEGKTRALGPQARRHDGKKLFGIIGVTDRRNDRNIADRNR